MTAEIKSQFSEIISSLERIVPYAAALYKKHSGLRVSVNARQQSVDPEDPAEGAVFTLWNGESFFEYATNKWTWSELKNTLADFARAARDARQESSPTRDIDAGLRLEQDFETPFGENPAEISPESKLQRAKERMEFAMSADPQMANAISILGDTLSEDVFVNRAKKLSQKIIRVDAILVVFVTDGQRMADVHGGVSKNGGLEKAIISQLEIRNMVADAKRLLSAERLKPGTYEVVTDPEWSGIIAHECFGHGMETDLYVRQRALSQQYIGREVASPIVNMFDDPSQIEEAGGFFFDDEGQPSNATHIIKNGVLERGLTDMASASALHLTRSANGRRESYARKAYARMTNTFFDNGTHSPAELIGSVKDGLYLRHATNGMEDPQAWGIQVEGLWAQEIKAGKLTDRVYSPVIMTGFVPDLLKSISMIGNDRFISGLGMCGKGHKEWVKNTTGGPHLKMKARLA
jgi:TldD protein